MSFQAKMNDLSNRRQIIELLGGKEAIDKMHGEGKMTSRERISALLDENSFVEIGAFVRQRATNFNLEANELPADGVVTGSGTINGRLVYVYSQDATILGGAIGEMHAKKIVACYDLAIKTGAPIIGLIDTAGLRLQESSDALDAFGQIYMKQTLASGVIPQISAILGNCGGGAAVMSSFCDFTLMTQKNSNLYVNSPNVLSGGASFDAAASAKFHSEETGLVDFVYEDEKSLFVGLRDLIELLPANYEEEAPYSAVEDDLNRISNELETMVTEKGAKGRLILQTIADDQRIFEVKKNYGREVVTAFAKMNGMTVGMIANQSEGEDDGRLTGKGLDKTARFVKFCDAFGIAIVSATDVVGYSAKLSEEKAALAKAAAQVTAAFASATVPKINVLVNRGFGSAYVSFNSKHIGADLVYAWPQASVSMMDATSAVKIIYANEIAAAAMASDVIAQRTAEYTQQQSSPYAAASRGYIDDVIEPAATRKRVIAALEMLYTKKAYQVDRKHSTI